MKKNIAIALLAILLVSSMVASAAPPVMNPLDQLWAEINELWTADSNTNDRIQNVEDTMVHDDQNCPSGYTITGFDNNGDAICAEKIKGDTGEQGIQGEKGDKGDTGVQGPAGVVGPQGPAGISGYEIVEKQVDRTEVPWLNGYAQCPMGKKVIGGGYGSRGHNAPFERFGVVFNKPAGDYQWFVSINDPDGNFYNGINVYAICVNVE